MKIAIISDLWMPFPGGAERFLCNIADELVDRGHDIHVLTSYARAKAHVPITIQDIGVRDRHDHGSEVIFNFMSSFHPDVFLIHHFFDGEFPEIYEWGLPVIQISHNRPRNPAAAFTVFNSEYTAGRCRRQPGDLVILPPPGRDTFTTQGFRHWIGHVKPQGGKGIELTYRLAKTMPDRYFLILRGEWQDGEMIVNEPNVEYMEPCDDIRDFYSRCRIMLMPSISEDAGTIPQESAVNGIPCISSDVGGLPETNAGGILLSRDRFEEWVDEILKLDNPAQYRSIVDRQRAHLPDWKGKFDELDRRIRCL